MADGIQLGAGEQPASGDNNTSGANEPGAGEKSAAMMARPDWVPEKFFKDGVIDYKGIAVENQYLASKQGKGEQNSQEKPAGEQPVKPSEQNSQPAPSIPGVAAERVTHFTGEIQKDGKLSDGSYEELAKLGYPKPVVDAYVRGLGADKEVESAVEGAAIATRQIDEIKASVGGESAFNEMLGWAKANWSPADAKVYNDAVGSKDAAKVKMAVQGLAAAYKDANGEQPNYLNLNGSKASGGLGVEPYANEAAVAADMAKPEYHRDEAFRQKVAARLKISDVFRQSRDVTKVQRA